jgi:hypothetical protein
MELQHTSRYGHFVEGIRSTHVVNFIRLKEILPIIYDIVTREFVVPNFIIRVLCGLIVNFGFNSCRIYWPRKKLLSLIFFPLDGKSCSTNRRD